jgi:hypothetical protein
MKRDVKYETGFTLTYEGVKFTEVGIKYSDEPLTKIVINGDNIPPKTFQFCENFNNVGALIMRFHFGQSQRSGSLTQVVRSNYKDYAIDKVSQGNDQINFFEPSENASEVVRNNLKLQQLASYPLGEAKILNRLTQAIRERNAIISGEQGLFGTIHTAVWQPVISLPSHLQKSGFLYVPCPSDINPEEYQEISKNLEEDNFSFNEDGTKIIIKNYTIDPTPLSNIKIHPQEKEGLTFQKNGLLINQKNSQEKAPLGWIIHTPSKKALAQKDTEDLIRLIRLSEGKFHQLTPFQQQILMAGRLEDNDRVRFTQNRQLNAMLSIFATLEIEFGFDPNPLLNNVLKQIAKATNKSIEETSVLDDFLTGIVQTEMIQHLVVTRSNSERAEFPPAFNLNFKAIKNNAKALAYAFSMKDGEGTLVLQNGNEKDPFYVSSELPDLGINGKLLAPSLTDSRHCAALLSTAILVAEQMIIEQLIASQFLEESNEKYAIALKSFLEICLEDKSNAEKAYNHLIQLAQDKKHLGLQDEDSSELIQELRRYIGTDQLINLAALLGTEGYFSPEKILDNMPSHAKEASMKSLKNLHLICDGLQTLPGVTAATVGSDGAVRGTSLIISKLFPELAKSLGINEDQRISSSSEAKQEKEERVHPKQLAACPYLQAKRREYNAPINSKGTFFGKKADQDATSVRPDEKSQSIADPVSDTEKLQHQSSSTKESWCLFFGKTIITVGVGAACMAFTAYLNQ